MVTAAESDETSEATRTIAPDAGELEHAVEVAPRPKCLSEFVGQQVVRNQLQPVLDVARGRAVTPDHVLLAGPPGLGKTTLAMIIAAEMGTSLRLISGPAIRHAGDLAVILSGLQEDDILFIGGVRRLARTAEEILHLVMEDFRVDVVVGKGPGATSTPLTLPLFTVVGVTIRSGLLPAPLCDHSGFTTYLRFYMTSELESVVARSAELPGAPLGAEAAREVVSRSHGTPRIADRLLRRVADYAQVRGSDVLDLEAAQGALELFEVDRSGLDRLDRAVLGAICRRFAGGPVGLTTLVVTVGEEAEMVETVAEPYLVCEGFLVRTDRGRVATGKARAYLGLTPPQELALFD